MIHRKTFLFALTLLCVLYLGACGKAPAAPQTPAAPAETEDPVTDNESAAAPETQNPAAPTPAPPSDASAPQDSAAPGSGGASDSSVITAEEAENIALEHAGVSREDISYIRTELDIDDGVQEYEVEFYVGNTEYDYDIDAATGTILEWDAESVFD